MPKEEVSDDDGAEAKPPAAAAAAGSLALAPLNGTVPPRPVPANAAAAKATIAQVLAMPMDEDTGGLGGGDGDPRSALLATKAALQTRLDALPTAAKPLVKAAEPERREAHWDFVLKEMMWMAADFETERKRHTNMLRQRSKQVLMHWRHKETEERRKTKEVQLELRKRAARAAREVRTFWAKIDKVVGYKQRLELDEQRRKAMDKHLVSLVRQVGRSRK